jgi:hypothetical protein
MRYENPLYMAEDAGATDLIAGGRQLGISRGRVPGRHSCSLTAHERQARHIVSGPGHNRGPEKPNSLIRRSTRSPSENGLSVRTFAPPAETSTTQHERRSARALEMSPGTAAACRDSRRRSPAPRVAKVMYRTTQPQRPEARTTRTTARSFPMEAPTSGPLQSVVRVVPRLVRSPYAPELFRVPAGNQSP